MIKFEFIKSEGKSQKGVKVMLMSKVTSLFIETNERSESENIQKREREYISINNSHLEQSKPIVPPLIVMNIESMLNQGSRVFVLDMNGSLAPICAPMGAKSLSLCADMSLSINPYTNIPEKVSGYGYQIRNDMNSLLRQIIFYMSYPFSDSQRLYVDQSLNHAWMKEGSEASLDTIVDFLLTHDKKEAHEIGQRLEKFSSRGNYGCLFDGPSQLSFSESFHAINLSQLWVYPPLRAIVLQFLLLGIFQEMTKGHLSTDNQRDMTELSGCGDVLLEARAGVIQSLSIGVCEVDDVSLQTPFLIIIEDFQSILEEEKLRDFLKLFENLIAKYQGKIHLLNKMKQPETSPVIWPELLAPSKLREANEVSIVR